MFSMSLWKESQLLQILNNPSIKYLIKLILYENDAKLLKFNRSPVKVNLWYVWSVRFWLLIPEMNTSRKATEWLTCFSIVNLMLMFQYLLLYLALFQKKLTWFDITLTDTDTQHTQGPVDLHTHKIYIYVYMYHTLNFKEA